METRDCLRVLLAKELGFNGSATNYATHSVHPFAAKFPPALPRLFIDHLTLPSETVLDPMAGSGTAIVEAITAGRTGLGLDFDPLAVKIVTAKTERFEEETGLLYAEMMADRARMAVGNRSLFRLEDFYRRSYDEDAQDFFDYWFLEETIWELAALIQSIQGSCPRALRTLFEVIFSSVIIAKSGGVSLARDLAHSRPHRDESKKVPSAIDLFWERAKKIISAVSLLSSKAPAALIAVADSRSVPLKENSVDLIVTSPPYANAIDYVRAHKFSLIWLGFSLKSLAARRRQYIGSEVGEKEANLESPLALETIKDVRQVDLRRSQILTRYLSDMRKSLSEMYRVLKPGKAAIVVVGSSTIRGINVRTPFALAEEAKCMGFEVIDVRERAIDRNRRLMPMSRNGNGSGIEARMREEHVVGLFKPPAAT